MEGWKSGYMICRGNFPYLRLGFSFRGGGKENFNSRLRLWSGPLSENVHTLEISGSNLPQEESQISMNVCGHVVGDDRDLISCAWLWDSPVIAHCRSVGKCTLKSWQVLLSK